MRPAAFVATALVCCLVAASPVRAEDEPSEIWTFRKGEVTRDLDVTHISSELRQSLLVQLEAGGWKRVKVATTAPGEAPAAREEEAPPPPPEAKPKPTPRSSTKRDLEELVRRGGRLPEGFVPHGMPPPEGRSLGGPLTAGFGRAAGKLILRYLEVKDDPRRGPIYEEVLRELANALTREPDEPGAAAHAVGMRLLEFAMKGLQGYVDGGSAGPESGVYREIVEILRDAANEAVRGLASPRPPGVPPAPGPLGRDAPRAPIDMPRELGGATLALRAVAPDHVELRVVAVPADSLAREMGLRRGDAILAIDGRPADLAGLRRARDAVRKAGQLTLRVKRMDGRIEQLDIEFEVEDQPGARRGP